MNPFDTPDYRGLPSLKYLRVSDKSQTTRGDGLNSQDVKCSDYANYLQSETVRTFVDDVSGSKQSREGMDDVIRFLKNNRKTGPYLVIIDDVSRLARDIRVYWDLRDSISAAGGILVSPNMTFRDDADGRHYQNMQASNAEWQRLKNKEQTNSRMRGRLKNGHWPFKPPIGYKHIKVKGISGKIIVRDEPFASIVQEALEGFASGRFETQAEVARFLETFPEYPKDYGNTVRYQRVKELLTKPIYAGYIEYKPWSISLLEADHLRRQQNLITLATYEKIQDRLTAKPKAPARKDIAADFPLRGAVVCGECGTPLTASWSKARNGTKHPYYLCPKKGCDSYGKSIRRDVIEGEFEELLARLQPSAKLFELAKAMLKQIWDYRLEAAAAVQISAKTEKQRIEQQIEKLLDRIVDASTPSVIGAFENRIAKLEKEKLLLAEKAAKTHKPSESFEETLRTAMRFWSNPQKLWASGALAHKRMLLRMAFAERLVYVRNEGLRTANLALPFKVLRDINTENLRMAHPRGFEPLASAFGV